MQAQNKQPNQASASNATEVDLSYYGSQTLLPKPVIKVTPTEFIHPTHHQSFHPQASILSQSQDHYLAQDPELANPKFLQPENQEAKDMAQQFTLFKKNRQQIEQNQPEGLVSAKERMPLQTDKIKTQNCIDKTISVFNKKSVQAPQTTQIIYRKTPNIQDKYLQRTQKCLLPQSSHIISFHLEQQPYYPLDTHKIQLGNLFFGQSALKKQLGNLKYNKSNIQNPDQQPFSAVGLIVCKFTYQVSKTKNKTKIGNGFIISDNIIATAAHLIVDINCQQPYQTQIWFYPNADLKGKGYQLKQNATSQKYKQAEQDQTDFQDSPRDQHDYAFLSAQTNDSLDQLYGSIVCDFSWSKDSPFRCKLNNITLPFYQEQKKQNYRFVAYEGNAIYNKELLHYNLPTVYGASGAPILCRVNEQYIAIGIHSSRGNQKLTASLGYKKGVGFKPNMYQNIQPDHTYLQMILDLSNQDIYENWEVVQYFIRYFQIFGSINLERYRTSLNLEFTGINAQGCSIILYLSPNVETIILSNNAIGDEGCKNLINEVYSKYFEKNSQVKYPILLRKNTLRKLCLSNNGITSQGCQYIAKSKWSGVEILNLSWNSIKSQGCKWIAEAEFKRMQQLFLSHCVIGLKGIQNLVKAKWIYLKQLQLGKNEIGDEGCKQLVLADWPNLRILNLARNQIGNKGCFYLKTGHWSLLTQLYLPMNRIDDQGCRQLSQGKWRHLEMLGLLENEIKGDPQEYFKRRNIEIQFNKKDFKNG